MDDIAPVVSRPCRGCPFSRGVTPGEIGGSSPQILIGHAHGPSYLPCHACYPEGERPVGRFDVRQCAGAAIYRTNVGAELPAGLARLPADTQNVFASPAELLAHHADVPLAMAEAFLAAYPVIGWVRIVLLEAARKGLVRRLENAEVRSGPVSE